MGAHSADAQAPPRVGGERETVCAFVLRDCVCDGGGACSARSDARLVPSLTLLFRFAGYRAHRAVDQDPFEYPGACARAFLAIQDGYG